MIQEHLNVKEFVVKQSDAFRLRVKSLKCVAPSNLNSIEFINESLNDKGEIINSSTYNFFMSDQEIQKLCEGLTK